LAIAALDLVGSNRSVGLIESHHIDLDRPNGFAIRQRTLSALGFPLWACERVYEPVSRTRDAKDILFPYTVTIAFPQAFSDRRFKNFAVTFVRGAYDACGS
jgi:hypothetical protein